jgi:hypothetical protein
MRERCSGDPAPGYLQSETRVSVRETQLTDEGITPLAASAATALPILAQPLVAVLLGGALGLFSVLVSRASARLVTPEDAMMGVAKLALVSTVRVLVVLAALTAYFLLARTAFVPFAIALVVTFLVTLGYEAFKASSATRRSTRTG